MESLFHSTPEASHCNMSAEAGDNFHRFIRINIEVKTNGSDKGNKSPLTVLVLMQKNSVSFMKTCH